MAGDWIKVEHTLPDKPEIDQLAEALGIDHDAVVGKLVRLWIWADQHTTNGETRIPSASLDRRVNFLGFAAALRKVGWLEGREGSLSFPRFDRHNGHSAKKRMETNRRVAEHRERADVREVIPRPLRREIIERDGHACVYCHRKEGAHGVGETRDDGTLWIDHVFPVARGGANVLQNMVSACRPCNMKKGNRTPEECGMEWPIDAHGNKFGVTSPLPKALPEKRREDKEPPTPCAPFVRFWEMYPKKKDKVRAEKAYSGQGCAKIESEVIEGLRNDMASAQWNRDDGQFIPHPATWLHNRRWETAELPINGSSGFKEV